MEYISKDVEEILLNKKEFIEEVANRCMLTPYVIEEIYNVSSGLIIEKLICGESIDIAHVGKFKLNERGETTYKNLFGKQEKTIEKTVYPTFLICNNIKNRVKNSYKNRQKVRN